MGRVSREAAKNRDSTDGGWAVRSLCRIWGWEGKGGPQMGEPFDTAPRWNGFGAAMSSSPWEWVWNGDEDVATPFHAGAASRGCLTDGQAEAQIADETLESCVASLAAWDSLVA
jgi:hypothetical protein